jgi:Cdc6-like AAA superfamily ATPase
VSEKLNKALLRLSKRAESVDRQKLVETFVDTGALVTLLTTKDHQLIYGRRGTGKTHALLYLSETVRAKEDLAIYIDMRTIGSTGGIYADSSIVSAQ